MHTKENILVFVVIPPNSKKKKKMEQCGTVRWIDHWWRKEATKHQQSVRQ